MEGDLSTLFFGVEVGGEAERSSSRGKKRSEKERAGERRVFFNSFYVGFFGFCSLAHDDYTQVVEPPLDDGTGEDCSAGAAGLEEDCMRVLASLAFR